MDFLKKSGVALRSLKSELYRKKLHRILGTSDDEGFCLLVWAVDAIQSGRERAGSRVIQYPVRAATSSVNDEFHIHKWALETLVNELLVAPKKLNSGHRLNLAKFDSIALVNGLLRDLENADDGAALGKTDILQSLPRLGHRQFEWQRGHTNVTDLYRSLYLFAGPAATAYFQRKYGLAPHEFVLCGFVAYAMFRENAAIELIQDLPELGVSPELFKATFSILAGPIKDVRREVKTMRSAPGHVGYKASVLRSVPCIIFENRLRAPLCELLFARVTSGIYYDVIGAGGNVRREIGERFEDYCFDLLSDPWDGTDVERSFKYFPGGPGRSIDSPDLRIRLGGETMVIAECKAKRMPLVTRFGEDPLKDPAAQQGFDEVAKGIFQIWRYNSHVRKGLIPNEQIHTDAIGVVITIDNWLILARGRYDDFLARARELAADDGGIAEIDRCPVAFCSITDLERALMTATLDSFCNSLRDTANTEFAGWHFARIHDRHAPKCVEVRPYPFSDKIGDVLPWWDSLGRDR